MPLSDCKYGSNTQTDHAYSLHSFPMAETYGNKPVRTFLDFRHINVSENIKWVPLLSLTNLRRVSKVKVVSFLMGLTLMFIVMASYVLTWDKKGYLFTPSPDQIRPVAALNGTPAADVSSENSVLVKIIVSKLEYTPRKVPDEKEVVQTDPHVSVRQNSLTMWHSVWHKVLVNDNAVENWRATNPLQSALQLMSVGSLND